MSVPPVPVDAGHDTRDPGDKAQDDNQGVLLAAVLQPLSDCWTTRAAYIVDARVLMVNSAPRCGCFAHAHRLPPDASGFYAEHLVLPDRWRRFTGRRP